MSQVGTVNDVDHRDDVPARSLPEQRHRRGDDPAGQHDAEEHEQRLHEPGAFEGVRTWSHGIRHGGRLADAGAPHIERIVPRLQPELLAGGCGVGPRLSR